MIYEFEYDLAKSEANKAKHGIDFAEAQQLWEDGYRSINQTRSETEVRWLVTSQLFGRFWTAVYTWRGKVIRLISVRRAREMEIEHYEDNKRRRIRQEI